MKKLLFILLLGSGIASAQPMAHSSVKEISNDTVMVGDSAWVGIRAVDALPDAMTDTFRLYLFNTNATITIQLWHKTYWDIMTGPKYFSNGDSLTLCKFKIPSVPTGQYKYQARDNSMQVYINNPTGINEYSNQGKIIHSEYYNLAGQKTAAPTPGTITMQMDYYEGGYIARKKIVVKQ